MKPTLVSYVLAAVGFPLVFTAVTALLDWRYSALAAGVTCVWFAYVASTKGGE